MLILGGNQHFENKELLGLNFHFPLDICIQLLKKTIFLNNLENLEFFKSDIKQFYHLQIQQTPNPWAQTPAERPPILEHSD